MSIAAATRNAYAVAVEDESPEFREASGASAADSALERVVEWIPSEAVGIYIALLGLFSPTGNGRWVLFAIGVAVVCAVVLVNAAIVNKRGLEKWKKAGKKGEGPKLSGRKLFWVVALTQVAFLTYAWALPNTPFTDWVDDATLVGGAAAIILAPFLPKIAELAGVQPPNT